MSKEVDVVSPSLRERLLNFTQRVGEPYSLVEKVSSGGVRYIMNTYVPRIIALPEEEKTKILKALEESWLHNQDHAKVRHWGRAAIGTARFLLLPTTLDEIEAEPAVDVVVRVSRWHHTTGSNIWRRFQPTASFVVSRAWGDIERLHEMFGQ